MPRMVYLLWLLQCFVKTALRVCRTQSYFVEFSLQIIVKNCISIRSPIATVTSVIPSKNSNARFGVGRESPLPFGVGAVSFFSASFWRNFSCHLCFCLHATRFDKKLFLFDVAVLRWFQRKNSVPVAQEVVSTLHRPSSEPRYRR